jgi:ligand-binding sensor domain-containing protein/AraC-like DNA-binding protein
LLSKPEPDGPPDALARLDKAGGFDYKGSNMPTGKSLPPHLFVFLQAVLIFLVLAGGSLFPVSHSELKIEYDRWVRRSWTTENGLPQNTVYALAQTNDGCLWIGSNGGLARFDGFSFTVFKKSNTPGLGSDWITSLCPDQDGSLWIGTFGGGLVNCRAGKFKRIAGLGTDSIWTICQDRAGTVWIGSADSGIYALEKGKLPAAVIAEGIPDLKVTAVGEDGEGRVWIGTRSGLLRLHGGERSRYLPFRDLAGSYVYCLFTDSRKNLWVGTTTGLVRINESGSRKFTSADGLVDDLVLAVGEDTQGRLWIGSDRGLTVLEPNVERVRTTKEYLGGDAVMAIHRDREGNMWVGTSAGGLSLLRRNEVRVVDESDGLSSRHVRPVCEDRLGRLWVGTRDQGLILFAGGKWRSLSRRDGLASDAVTSLVADGAGRLWIGTRDAGLQCLDKGVFTSHSRGSVPAAESVLSLFVDRQERLWIGNEGSGLDCLSAGVWKHHGLAAGLKGTAIISLNEDSRGSLLAGSSGAGLQVLRAGAWRQFTMADGLPGDTVNAIHVDGGGDVWLGTSNGLGLLRQERFFNFREAPGPLNGVILDILEDDAGQLWMSSPAGIFRVKKSSCEAYVRGEDKALHCRLFNEMSGLKSTVCVGGFQPAGCRTRDGQLWFPTENGLAVIDPGRLGPPPPPPLPWLEKVQADGRSLPLAGGNRLPAGTKRLDFLYAAATFADPQQLEFSSRVQGGADHWSVPAREHNRQVGGLTAGSYEFRVRARGQSGEWREDVAAFAFTILPRFHRTGLFFILLLGGCGAAVAGWIVSRRRLARKRRLDRYRLSPLTADKIEEYAARLEEAMETENLHLDPGLTLAKLAEATAIPAKHLSQVINEHFELNFNDFVNRYRVEAAKRLLLDPASGEFKLLRIAYESGFNSKSVFNAAFKSHAGLSPSEFRRLLGGD